MAPLTLPSSSASINVRLQPTVLLNICDAYVRRSENQERVVGTLLGSIEGTVVEIKDCYAVPFNESQEQVAMDINHHQSLLSLHQKVNSKEHVIGWFSTGLTLSGSDAVMNDFYAKECSNPVHLTVDTTLQDNKLAINVYVAKVLSLDGRSLATEFQTVDYEVLPANLEHIRGDAQNGSSKRPELDSLHKSIVQLQHALAGTFNYVDEVVKGRRKPDAVIGRYLADTVAAVPYLSQEELGQLCTDTSQDMLLLLYLSSLVRAQLALADKLGTSALPLL